MKNNNKITFFALSVLVVSMFACKIDGAAGGESQKLDKFISNATKKYSISDEQATELFFAINASSPGITVDNALKEIDSKLDTFYYVITSDIYGLSSDVANMVRKSDPIGAIEFLNLEEVDRYPKKKEFEDKFGSKPKPSAAQPPSEAPLTEILRGKKEAVVEEGQEEWKSFIEDNPTDNIGGNYNYTIKKDNILSADIFPEYQKIITNMLNDKGFTERFRTFVSVKQKDNVCGDLSIVNIIALAEALNKEGKIDFSGLAERGKEIFIKSAFPLMEKGRYLKEEEGRYLRRDACVYLDDLSVITLVENLKKEIIPGVEISLSINSPGMWEEPENIISQIIDSVKELGKKENKAKYFLLNMGKGHFQSLALVKDQDSKKVFIVTMNSTNVPISQDIITTMLLRMINIIAEFVEYNEGWRGKEEDLKDKLLNFFKTIKDDPRLILNIDSKKQQVAIKRIDDTRFELDSGEVKEIENIDDYTIEETVYVHPETGREQSIFILTSSISLKDSIARLKSDYDISVLSLEKYLKVHGIDSYKKFNEFLDGPDSVDRTLAIGIRSDLQSNFDKHFVAGTIYRSNILGSKYKAYHKFVYGINAVLEFIESLTYKQIVNLDTSTMTTLISKIIAREEQAGTSEQQPLPTTTTAEGQAGTSSGVRPPPPVYTTPEKEKDMASEKLKKEVANIFEDLDIMKGMANSLSSSDTSLKDVSGFKNKFLGHINDLIRLLEIIE